jgi:hypothetical protein
VWTLLESQGGRMEGKSENFLKSGENVVEQ